MNRLLIIFFSFIILTGCKPEPVELPITDEMFEDYGLVNEQDAVWFYRSLEDTKAPLLYVQYQHLLKNDFGGLSESKFFGDNLHSYCGIQLEHKKDVDELTLDDLKLLMIEIGNLKRSIESMKKTVKKIAYEDYKSNYEGYKKLACMEPSNAVLVKKMDKYKALKEKKDKKEAAVVDRAYTYSMALCAAANYEVNMSKYVRWNERFQEYAKKHGYDYLGMYFKASDEINGSTYKAYQVKNKLGC